MIPSIASRLDIIADIADQMDQNEENQNNIQQKLFFKFLIESFQKQQQQNKPIDFSTKIPEQHPFGSYLSTNNLLNSNENFLKEFSKRIKQAQEHLINVNQQDSIISPTSTNSIPLKKRYKSNTSPPPPPPSDMNQGDVYWERRQKNNEAAKRSRDARRVKEDEIAIRATLLEQENVKLRLENAHLKQENIHLRCQIYSSTNS